MLIENIKRLKEEIGNACLKSGRKPDDVRLIAVSKTMGIDKIQEAINAGLDTFGENYVQEALKKIEALPSSIHWHFIGNIQKNKVKFLVKNFELIHSVGSKEVAEEINKRAMQAGIKQPVLFEINIGLEETKSGFTLETFYEAIPDLKKLMYIEPLGLMTMPPPESDDIQLSHYFAKLRNTRDELLKQGVFSQSFKELSMGMSSDYKIAIKEGATMIRIGTAIFGPRG
ncbi:MAG: YggS family pyridoxal phosphate-dependent enzyme [bacterium]